MGRHAAEVSDLDRIVAEFECVDSDAIHLFTDQRDEDAEAGANPHNNFDPAYRFIPAPIRHRRTPDGKKYNPKPDRAFKDQWEAANRITAVADPTDDELAEVLAKNVDKHKSKVLPATEAEVPKGLLVPGFLLFGAGVVVTLGAQFVIAIAQGGVA